MTEVIATASSHHHHHGVKPTTPANANTDGAKPTTPGKSKVGETAGIDNTRPITYPVSEIHEKLLKCLKSNFILDCVFADVKNESYWYYQRSLLGPKSKTLSRLVKIRRRINGKQVFTSIELIKKRVI